MIKGDVDLSERSRFWTSNHSTTFYQLTVFKPKRIVIAMAWLISWISDLSSTSWPVFHKLVWFQTSVCRALCLQSPLLAGPSACRALITLRKLLKFRLVEINRAFLGSRYRENPRGGFLMFGHFCLDIFFDKLFVLPQNCFVLRFNARQRGQAFGEVATL